MPAGVQEPIRLPTVLSCVSELVQSGPEAFLTGDEATHVATLKATKFAFDLSLEREKHALSPIADLLQCIEPSTGPETRSQRKRKRSPSPPPPQKDEKVWGATPVESLHLQGMNDDQVWAQLELRATTLCEMLKAVLEESAENEEMGDEDDGSRMEDDDELESLDDDSSEDPNSSDSEDQDGDDIEGDDGFEEEVADLRDPSEEGSEEGSEDESGLDLDRPTRPSLRQRRGMTGVESGMHSWKHPILDDGFFSLADFNAETEEAEAKDVSKGRLGPDEEDEEEDVAEDDVDLFAAVDEVGRDTFEEDDLEEGGELYYKDFFAPPLLKSISAARSNLKELVPDTGEKTSKVRFHDEVRVKKIKRHGKGNPVSSMKGGISFEGEDDDDDGDFEIMHEELDDENDDLDEDGSGDLDGREYNKLAEGRGSRDTIERLKNDLFAEDDEELPRDLSTHEARQAEITAQIAKFEAKNVGPKEWTLLGEATSRSRPVNSLLEEDLDFERVMKVVPTQTEEQVGTIEQIIKKRIIDNHFDDVVRKQPADEKPFLPSRFFELNDQKSGQSLAQIYEDEYSAANSGNGGDDRDGKLKKEHEELAKLWDTICYKLDALSNARFTPKQPKVTISTTRNVSTISFESALPTTKSATSMLAPEEIFAAPSEIRSREELTPTEKRAHRNKQRKARRKAKERMVTSVDKFSRIHKAAAPVAASKEKAKALRHVVKTGKGITVVGKRISQLKPQNKEKGSSTAPTNAKPFKL